MSFQVRTTKPEAGNKYYIRKASGGWSDAVKGKPTDPDCDVLSNCVGYAYGRFNEIGNWGYCKYGHPVNAEKFIDYFGLPTSQNPQIGAIAVWQKGATKDGSDGAGHVCIVEKVISGTEIFTSESGYNSKAFWNQTRKKGSDGNWGQSSSYKFLGFILNPAPCCKTGNNVGDTSGGSSTSLEFKVGDIVNFTGSVHYTSANASSGPSVKASKAKITDVYPTGKHPYHVRAVNDAGAFIGGVYGWVDASAVAAIQSVELRVGDTVNFSGGCHYTNANAASGLPCKPGKAKITQIYLPEKSKHPYHLKAISGSTSNVYGWVDRDTVSKA